MNGVVPHLLRCMRLASEYSMLLLLCVIKVCSHTHNASRFSNFGYAHSGEGDDEYGDHSCMMGNFGGIEDDGPLMCFNAGKSWLLLRCVLIRYMYLHIY